MARRRLLQSTADYLAIAISPVLIMLLVGSLVFFLQEISYGGGYEGRVRWVLGWFVFATVLISRIGIEFGKAHASMYAGALALACMLFISRFLDEYLIGTIVLMGVIWWCVNKLTWDCTVIDDNEDSSGAGLLQQSGMDQPPPAEDEEPVETLKQQRRRLRRAQLLSPSEADVPPAGKTEPEEPQPPQKKKQHAPGVWVVYFSLAALPLFGIGQAFLPSEDGAIREGFIFLWIYVASALGLFLTTTFLGLRRYLRQRNISMPVRITAVWVSSGVIIMLLVLGLCLLIPRPHSGTSVTALLDRFHDDQSASSIALSSDDAGQGEGRHVGRADEDSDEPGDKLSEKGDPTKSDQQGNKQGQSDQKGKTQGGDQQNDDQQDGRNSEQQTAEKQEQKQNQKGAPADQENNQQQARKGGQQQNPSSSPSQISSTISKLAQPLKWLLYVVFGLLIAWALWKNRHNLAAGARELLQALADFWTNLFGRKQKQKKQRKPDEPPALVETGPPPKRFAEYDNPFLTGEAHRLRPDALVIYTEEALRAFGRELGVYDGEEITTAEFSDEVADRLPELSEPIRFLTSVHSRILYSSHPPTNFDIKLLETLWTGMTRREPQAVG